MLKWLWLLLSALAAAAIAQSAPSATVESADSQPVYKVGAGVTAPVLRYRPEPEISEKQARVRHRSGTVALTAIIGSDGRVSDVKVTRGYDPEYDAAALKAVKQWTFDPARKDGVPVAVKVNIDVDFHIDYDGVPAMRDWQSQLCTRAYPGTIAAGSPAAAMQAGCEKLGQAKHKKQQALAIPDFEQAAAQGFANAQLMLAGMNEDGMGVKKDKVAALRWFQIALHSGSPEAQPEIDRLSKKMKSKDVEAASSQANEWVSQHSGK
jgi:protein TonB